MFSQFFNNLILGGDNKRDPENHLLFVLRGSFYRLVRIEGDRYKMKWTD
jgi:hypothetical protein